MYIYYTYIDIYMCVYMHIHTYLGLVANVHAERRFLRRAADHGEVRGGEANSK